MFLITSLFIQLIAIVIFALVSVVGFLVWKKTKDQYHLYIANKNAKKLNKLLQEYHFTLLKETFSLNFYIDSSKHVLLINHSTNNHAIIIDYNNNNVLIDTMETYEKRKIDNTIEQYFKFEENKITPIKRRLKNRDNL